MFTIESQTCFTVSMIEPLPDDLAGFFLTGGGILQISPSLVADQIFHI